MLILQVSYVLYFARVFAFTKKREKKLSYEFTTNKKQLN